MTDTRPLLRTWTGVVLISFSAVYVRLADVEAARSAFLRNAYALPVLAVIAVVARRRSRRANGGVLLPLAVAAGVLLGTDLIAFHLSIGIIGAGLGTVVPNLQVVFVALIAYVVFRERPHASFWLALPVVLAGIAMLGATGESVTAGGNVLLGLAFGVMSAIFYAGYIVVLRMSRMRAPAAGAPETMASATLGAVMLTGAYALTQGVAAPAGRWPADGWLIALALGSQVAGWLLLASSIHRLPASLTSLALLLQPALALVWGAVLLGEPLGVLQLAGAAVLLAGVTVAHRAVVLGARDVPLEDETLT